MMSGSIGSSGAYSSEYPPSNFIPPPDYISSSPLTDAQIYERIIKKAVSLGWDNKTFEWEKLKPEDFEYQVSSKIAYRFIYDHDFAKAIWLEEASSKRPLAGHIPAPMISVPHAIFSPVAPFSTAMPITPVPYTSTPSGSPMPEYKINLSQMVALENPYLFLQDYI